MTKAHMLHSKVHVMWWDVIWWDVMECDVVSIFTCKHIFIAAPNIFSNTAIFQSALDYCHQTSTHGGVMFFLAKKL